MTQKLNKELVNHVLDSTDETLSTMMNLELLRCRHAPLPAAGIAERLTLTAIIGLVSKQDFLVRLVLAVSDGVAVRLTSFFLGESGNTLNIDVIDAMKEVVNIVAGAASAKMPEHMFSLTLPVVLIGQNSACAGSNGGTLNIPLFVPECGRMRLGLSVNSQND